MSGGIADLHSWFAEHNGVVGLSRAQTFGLSRSSVYRMAERGELKLLQPGVFQSTQWPTGELQLMTAACVRNPHAAIGFLTAAKTWSFRSLRKDRLVHVVVPHGSSPELHGVVVHRTRRIDPVDLVLRDDGIRVTSPSRTLLDVADAVGDIAAASILEQLINDGRGTFATHASTLARLGHAQRPGTATMARIISSRPKWSKALQSALEAQVLAEIRRQGLPEPEIQCSLDLPGGGRIRFDFAWPQWRLALEVDHPFWHAGGEQSHLDKRRDRQVATLGWQTIRVTDLDVASGLEAAIAELASLLGDRLIVAP